MSEQKLQIVMFSMSSYSEWQAGVQNRNYHILQNLIKDERVGKVITVDYLPPTWKRFYKNWQRNILAKTAGEITVSNPLVKIIKISDKLTVYSSVFSKISKKKFYGQLKRFLSREKFKNFIVWSYYPLDVDYFKELPAKLFIFDTVDNWCEHPSYEKFKNQLKENYQIIDRQADLIFTVSADLQKLYEDSNKVYWISNGVDLKHYQQSYPIINRDIGEIKKPIIGYVGTIQDRLDQDLLEYLAKSNPDKSIVMVGPIWYPQIKERFKKFSNIYFLGRKSYEEVPMYIQQFDVGIIPHKIDKFIKSTNPMKMYEYLACQKPVVSTAGGDIEQFKDLVYITNDFKQFNDYLQKALKDDNHQLKERRLASVKDHSWLKKVEEMLNLLEQKL
ncbi:glycosyltransferase [Patescibacteria group bacterium]|nr:glycosyltransferase [Patescibacteria group bacterium]